MQLWRWSPYLQREGAKPAVRGPLVMRADQLLLDSKIGMQVQLRIYLYSKDEKATPTVSLLGRQRAGGGCDPRRGGGRSTRSCT